MVKNFAGTGIGTHDLLTQSFFIIAFLTVLGPFWLAWLGPNWEPVLWGT